MGKSLWWSHYIFNNLPINMIWEKFWKRTVLWEGENLVYSGKKYKTMNCRCDCWLVKDVRKSYLKSWQSKWCRTCWNKDNNWTHWMRHTKFWTIRQAVKRRCNNPNSAGYHRYWWRWICYDRKRESFEWFYEDMYEWYEEWLSIDRIDNDWNYCKSNCRRANRITQARNMSSNKYINWWWEEYLQTDFSEKYWIPHPSIVRRRKQWKIQEMILKRITKNGGKKTESKNKS